MQGESPYQYIPVQTGFTIQWSFSSFSKTYYASLPIDNTVPAIMAFGPEGSQPKISQGLVELNADKREVSILL